MVPAALSAWLAALALVEFTARTALVIAVIAILVGALSWDRLPAVTACALALAVTALSVGWRLAAMESSPVLEWAEQRGEVTAEVVLRDDPHRASNGSLVWNVVIREVTFQNRTVTTRMRALVFSHEDGTPPAAGDTVTVRARLAPARDSESVATLNVTSEEHATAPRWWWTAADGVRQALRRATARHTDPPAALVPALVAGDETGLDQLTRDDFQQSGLTHLLAVSGANLTIVLGVVLWLLRALGGRRLLVPVGILVTVAFVLVARPEPSVQRAAVMGVVGLLALGRSTATSGIRALAWAVITLVTIDPWLGGQAGFVLSVCATAGILVLAPPLAARFEQWSPRPLALAVAVPLAAQLACLPVVAALSGTISLVSLAANMLAAMAVAPATVCGLLAGLLYLVWPPLAWPVAECAWAAAWWIVTVGNRAAATPGATIAWSTSAWWLVPLVVAVTAALLRWGKRRLVMLSAVTVLILAVVRPGASAWLPEQAVVIACDVGQGDAFVIPVAAGTGIVVDAGEQPALVDQCLRTLGIDTVPLAVLSHGDADHVGGWPGVARGRSIGTVLVGPSGAPGVSVPLREAKAGEVFTVGAVRVEVLWPRDSQPAANTNDQSLVVMIDTGQTRVLFAGDLSARAQRRLAAADLDTDVLKMPHHGSGDFWPGLLDAASPSVAMIGVGVDNRHGHPADSVLAALAERNILVARTDQDGTFAVVSAPSGWGVVRRRLFSGRWRAPSDESF